MTETTLKKCLNKLDTIIFHDYENIKDVDEIIKILNDVRTYIIDSTLKHNKMYNERSFMIILEFINYMIQESFHPITNQFISHLRRLRLLIIKFKRNRLCINKKKIDFDEEYNSFLYEYVTSVENKHKDEDGDEDE